VSNSIDPDRLIRTAFATTVGVLLTLSPLNKVPSAKSLVRFNFKSTSMLLKIGENVLRVPNSLNPGEIPSFSASHPDPSCLQMAHFCALRAEG